VDWKRKISLTGFFVFLSLLICSPLHAQEDSFPSLIVSSRGDDVPAAVVESPPAGRAEEGERLLTPIIATVLFLLILFGFAGAFVLKKRSSSPNPSLQRYDSVKVKKKTPPVRKKTPAPKPVEKPIPAPKPAEQPIPAPKPAEQPIPAPKPVEKPASAPKPAEQSAPAPKPVEQPAPAPKPDVSTGSEQADPSSEASLVDDSLSKHLDILKGLKLNKGEKDYEQ